MKEDGIWKATWRDVLWRIARVVSVGRWCLKLSRAFISGRGSRRQRLDERFRLRLHVLWGRAAAQRKPQALARWSAKQDPAWPRGLGISREFLVAVMRVQRCDGGELRALPTLEKAGLKAPVGSPACVSAGCLICEDLWFDKLVFKDIRNK